MWTFWVYQALWALDTPAQGVTLKTLTTLHPAWLGLIPSLEIGNDEVFGCYFVFLIYPALTKEGWNTEQYGAGIMQMTIETIQKIGNELPEKVSRKNGIAHRV